MNRRCAALIFCLVSGLGLFLHGPVMPLQAQTVNATINGRISDPQGNVVPGAEIKAVNTDTGVEFATKTNDSGIYAFIDLPAGPYRLAVRKDGFKEINKMGLVLHIQDTIQQNFSLEIGSVSQSITVTGEAQMINVNSAEMNTGILQREYNDLPLVQSNRMRCPATFAYLAPGVLGSVTAVTGTDYTGATNQIGISGGQYYNTEILIDSIPAGYNSQIGNFTESSPPTDAVREFAVITSQMSAEYGHTGAGVVNFTLKSGTNQFHGDAYEYARNTVFDARSFLAPTRGIEKQNEFGGSVGGPVKLPRYNGTDRTFFYFTYAGARHAGLNTVTQSYIPTAQELAGNFSGLLNASGHVVPIYDPATTTLNASGVYTRTQFPGNIIPKTQMDPVALKVAQYYPAPNVPGSSNIYQGYTGDVKLNETAITAKMDHSLSDRNRLNGSFTFTTIPRETLSNPFPGPINSTDTQVVTTRTGRFSDVWTLKPNLVNDFTFGFDRFRNPFYPLTQGGGWPQKLGLTGLPAAASAFPVFSFTNGYSNLSANYMVDNIDQGAILKDLVSWSLGKHLLKFGIEARRYEPNNRTLSNDDGTFNFSNHETALPSSLSATGDGFASFLLGEVDSASVSYPSEIGTRKPYWGFFIQDEFKVAPKLTLTMGLRYEFDEAPWEAHDQSSALSLTTPNPAAGNIPGALIFAGSGSGRTGTRALSNTDYSALGPRFALAWQLNAKTAVRGGYGIYYSTSYVGLGTAGFTISGSEVSANNGVAPAFLLQNGFPQNFPTTPSTSPSFSNGQGASFFQPTTGNMPRTQNFTIGIQRELSNNVMIEANYIGNHGTREVANQLVNLNQLNPKYLALGSLLSQNINSAAAIAAGISVPYSGFTGSVAQALRPFPQYLTISTQAKAGNNVYNAFETGIKKRLSMGLSLDAHYEFSKNLGYTSSALSGGAGLDGNIGQDNYNPKNERTILPIDVAHALLINYTYDLPFGPGRRFLNGTGKLDKFVLGGWDFSAIQTYQSGTPLVISMTNSLPIFNTVLRPNRVSGQRLTTGIGNSSIIASKSRYINVNAFATPASYTFGTAPPEIQDLRNMPVLNENLSLIKVTPITERTSLKFMATFLNAFNRHRFGSFVTNFSNSTFGEATSTSNPRYIQLAMELTF